MKDKKEYKVYQTIWKVVEADNEMDAVEKIRNDESIYEGWTKWAVEEYTSDENITDSDDIIKFYKGE